ncbi:helix-turn-helix transcriptional regulator [Pseudoxanthomonas koreensis]|uniref:helix-turn-helix transcriptional regulator n=1 Tax=Pseudoxanthomonas koreensis TaxID=266061 RepID=UPI001390BAC6|nr:DNA-binding protein [Pseudoxanthomonas koreensis]KAF1695651.1 DNA-binding protein [Pseudoxanthomonas koreensis]
MSEYEFTLKFRLPDVDADPEQFIDALAEAGCDDATVGIGQQGRIALDFTREAADALEAIVSAVQAVKGAIPGAELIEASPDFVGLTDVADLVGCSRQNIRKLMISNPETFPAAVHEGSQAFWHLRPVLVWFSETQKRPIDRSLIEVSEVTMKVNIAKETRRMSGVGLLKELETLFA